MLQNEKQPSPDANATHVSPSRASPALYLNNAANTTAAGFRARYVLGDASAGARQALCSPVPSLPLSLHLMGPMGEATVASHVLLLTNDQVAATVLMNYAGRKGSNSTLSYVNLTLRRRREESCSGGGELVPSITRCECV